MEKNKLENIEKAAKEALDKAKGRAVLIADQNDDGKFDIDDVAIVAGAVGTAVKKGAATLKENAEESRKRQDLKLLQPIFPDTLADTDFYMSKLVRIVEKDKRYSESDVCQGSIGYVFDKGEIRVVNIFSNSVDAFGLSFYPDSSCGSYYVNPTDRDSYILLDDYFDYLKDARVNELQQVAQALGAKHFKVSFVEEQTSFLAVKGKAEAKIVKIGNAKAEHADEEKKYAKIDIAAEMTMSGHAPQEPKLTYLAKDTNVDNLIRLRMDGRENFQNYKKTMKIDNFSGIKENDAAKIDAVLNGLKASSSVNIAKKVRRESHRFLEYEIEF